MPYGLCTVISMNYALCSIIYTLCTVITMPYAICSMLYDICPMHYAPYVYLRSNIQYLVELKH